MQRLWSNSLFNYENWAEFRMNLWHDVCEVAVLYGYPMFYSVNIGTTLSETPSGIAAIYLFLC